MEKVKLKKSKTPFCACSLCSKRGYVYKAISNEGECIMTFCPECFEEKYFTIVKKLKKFNEEG